MFDFIRNLFGRANAQPAGKDAARKPAQGSGSGQSQGRLPAGNGEGRQEASQAIAVPLQFPWLAA